MFHLERRRPEAGESLTVSMTSSPAMDHLAPGVRRKKLARVPTKLRPVSFIDNQLILPPPARVSLLSASTASDSESEHGMDLIGGLGEKEAGFSSDDDVFQPEAGNGKSVSNRT